jgi:hypothetical protein
VGIDLCWEIPFRVSIFPGSRVNKTGIGHGR